MLNATDLVCVAIRGPARKDESILRRILNINYEPEGKMTFRLTSKRHDASNAKAITIHSLLVLAKVLS